ncbi:MULTISPECIES: hypothetical protein [Sphingobacterium]|jgi:DNA-directed RNA polymerase specialized sigma24 family protein|uniref:hypothetical protein n=1 Tax=Sphingobacterium TaxID=28453 RepID=UPI00104F9C0C|nr:MULTISPECIES: hypothetical protein [Sphingobacterium]MCW2261863.1 DNA-directed RNA polymerase specialized sigma24 family protein [Sphingobacterium kitahiroshimense]TCR10173.1 hypothetical protein EDF67_105447 [Sphingobacterium sp. JUb78]
MNKLYSQKNTKKQLIQLNKGIEAGLNYFYEKFYPYFYLRSNRATQDTCIATSITHEAFLRLWLYRENIHSEEDLLHFLKMQIKKAIHIFYSNPRSRFHRSLLQLDSIENYQEFLAGYEEDDDAHEDLVYLDKLDNEKQHQLDKLNKVLPFLNLEHQLFIRLSLQYSFNYERIAYYLGGISDYEVSLKVEKTIEVLRSILNSYEKINKAISNKKIVAQVELTDEQVEIFRMRYELQFSFEQISKQLHLNTTAVKKIFIEAHSKIKPRKKTA